jgi:hypothetical protein
MSTASGDDYLAPAVPVALPKEALVVLPEVRPRRWPFTLVAAVAFAGLLLISLGRLPQGVVALSAAFGLAALLRLVLPGKAPGLLASRTRLLDACGFAALAAAMAATLLLLK